MSEYIKKLQQNARRNEVVRAMYAAGLTHQQIGDLYGKTRQWAQAICKEKK